MTDTVSVINSEPLRSILNLEREKNYNNSSVSGGLDRFLQRWGKETKEQLRSSRLLTSFNRLKIIEIPYHSLDYGQRKIRIEEILQWLNTASNLKKALPVKRDHTTGRKRSATAPQSSHPTGEALDAPVTVIKGISTQLEAKLAKLNVKTVRDLLYLFPNRHLDYSQRKKIAELVPGEEQTVVGTIWESRVAKLGRQNGTKIVIADETGSVSAVWFNQPYLAKSFHVNDAIVLSGKIAEFGHMNVFESPEWELMENRELVHTGRLVPVYPLTQGLYPRQLRKLIKKTLDESVPHIEDFLPVEIKRRCQLLDLTEAIVQSHYPDSNIMKDKARKRLAFDELLLLQLGVLDKKRDWQETLHGNAFSVSVADLNRFQSCLPFSLTAAQRHALGEIITDLRRPKPMARLLQGDVGSGKTVVAVIALLVAVKNGFQGAFMAPTEILAEQHVKTICALLARMGTAEEEQGNIRVYNGVLSDRPIKLALLTGSLTEKEKESVRAKIRSGEIDIVIGTHALIQKGVEFRKLGLAVIDEQHRFGVSQRSALRQKGFSPHILVMTATPIPRTLALTLYGDLDLSIINELPPGRKIVKTKWIRQESREKAYDFLRQKVVAGQQAFIVCPLIEESEVIEAKAAKVEYERLSRQVFPDLKLCLLHGKLSQEDKEKVMYGFRQGEFDIMVATPVVEVGIDIPNATVMLVEAAERFGLSQLHQFRGRVGRGDKQSYCILLAGNPSPEGRQRLKAIESIYDGFALAEKDLEIRGPGEFFGTRQSGLPDLRMAKLSDTRILELARKEAIELYNRDKQLKLSEHRLLAKELARIWPRNSEWS